MMAETVGWRQISNRDFNPSADGFTLIEVLISVLLLTVGLLGLAALQGQALQASGMGGSTTVANALVRNAVDRILINSANVNAYAGMNTTTGARPNCPAIVPAPVCAQDFANWQNAITALPQGALQIASAAGANFNTVTVTVSWRDAIGNRTVALPVQVAQ